MMFELVPRLCPKWGKKRFFRWVFSIKHDWHEYQLKKIMHPILWKTPQLSWEAKKAGLRSPTLPHKQCKGILHHCQRCVFSSLDWSVLRQSQHEWNALHAAFVAPSFLLLLEVQPVRPAGCLWDTESWWHVHSSELCRPSAVPAQPSCRAALCLEGMHEFSCRNSAVSPCYKYLLLLMLPILIMDIFV